MMLSIAINSIFLTFFNYFDALLKTIDIFFGTVTDIITPFIIFDDFALFLTFSE